MTDKQNKIGLFDVDMRLNNESYWECCDVHTVARYLNVSPRRIQQLVQRGVLPPCKKRGEYDLIKCIHAFLNYLKKMINYYASRCAHSLPGFLESFEPPYDNHLYDISKKEKSKDEQMLFDQAKI